MFISHENPAELNGGSKVPVVLVIINEMLADFLGFVRSVPFPVFTSSLTKNRRTNTKGMEEKFDIIRLIQPFQILSQKHTFIYSTDR